MKCRHSLTRSGTLAPRFDLFAHWCPCSIEGWHEQDQWRRRIPHADFMKLQAR